MLIPAKRWLDAIYQRHSRRQYTDKDLPADISTKLRHFTEELNNHMSGAQVIFVNENPEQVFKGLVGSYGKVKGAPAYAVFMGDVSDPNFQEKVGYLGECFILEATASGLGTCWIGGAFSLETIEQNIQIPSDYNVLAVTPVGYPVDKYSFMEKTLTGMARSTQRKSLKELCEIQKAETWPLWVEDALQAARIAPSAVNRQPWRFRVEDKGIKVKVDSEKNSLKISKRLDCGIAMLHLEVGALASGISGNWQYLESPDVAYFEITER